jgi:hypothetical protein
MIARYCAVGREYTREGPDRIAEDAFGITSGKACGQRRRFNLTVGPSGHVIGVFTLVASRRTGARDKDLPIWETKSCPPGRQRRGEKTRRDDRVRTRESTWDAGSNCDEITWTPASESGLYGKTNWSPKSVSATQVGTGYWTFSRIGRR